MDQQGVREPLLEQQSTVTAITPEGKCLEFVTTLKVYGDRTATVKVAQPDSKCKESGMMGSTVKERDSCIEGDSGKTRDTGVEDKCGKKRDTGVEDNCGKWEDTCKREDSCKCGNENETPVKSVEKPPSTKTRVLDDEELKGTYPKPPGDCAITQFIPDPCKAIDDLQKSLSSVFSRTLCPPKKTEQASVVAITNELENEEVNV